MRLHDEGAPQLLAWQAREPQRAKQLVTWAILNPDQTSDVFVVMHPDWAELAALVAQHHDAAEAFLLWCRNHPRGSEGLVDHPEALSWAGSNPGSGEWHLARPPR